MAKKLSGANHKAAQQRPLGGHVAGRAAGKQGEQPRNPKTGRFVQGK